jgi:DNA-binding MurR/RpiR family transcriptional regulator
MTPEPNSVLTNLERHLDSLPDALARVGKYILENPEKVIRQSLSDVSRYSKSGQASVFRMCREIGFDGYSELKLALTAELAVRGKNRGAAKAARPDRYTAMAGQIAESVIKTAQAADPRLLHTLMTRLQSATRIDVFGAAVSGIAAELLAYRLLRLGLNAHAMRDATFAHEIASGLTARSAAIAISESGVTPDTVEFLRCAATAGAFTVAVTCNPSSQVARHAKVIVDMGRSGPPSYGGHVTFVPRIVYLAEAMALVTRAADGSDAARLGG